MAAFAFVWLSGCHSKGSPGGERIILGFSQSGAEGVWRTANSESIKSAAKAAGIDLRFIDAQQSQEGQIEALRSLISQRVDVIAYSPIAETGWNEVLREAKKAGIPVVLIERAVRVDDRSLYTTLLGSDFVEQGRNAGRWLLEFKLGRVGHTNIVELLGPSGSALSDDRKRGFREIIETDPHFRIIRSESGDFTRAGGRRATRVLLHEEGKQINVIFAHNDEMALGAIEAIEEARLKPGKDIIIISIDGIRGAFEAMTAGKLNVSVECNPLFGPQLMGVTQDLVARRRLPHRLVVEEFTYPMELARDALPTRKY
ncbi:MAG: ABC transporter substrate-binding protein [Gammaproteobacteria bacterium]